MCVREEYLWITVGFLFLHYNEVPTIITVCLKRQNSVPFVLLVESGGLFVIHIHFMVKRRHATQMNTFKIVIT